MPAMANVVINDGQATPVAHTFAPTDVGLWHDRSSNVPLSYLGLTAARVVPSTTVANGVHRVKFGISVPLLEVQPNNQVNTDGYVAPPAIAYVLRANMEFLLPVRSNLAQRKDLRAFVKNLMADAVVTALVENLESMY